MRQLERDVLKEETYRKERRKQYRHVKAVQGYTETNNQPQWLRK